MALPQEVINYFYSGALFHPSYPTAASEVNRVKASMERVLTNSAQRELQEEQIAYLVWLQGVRDFLAIPSRDPAIAVVMRGITQAAKPLIQFAALRATTGSYPMVAVGLENFVETLLSMAQLLPPAFSPPEMHFWPSLNAKWWPSRWVRLCWYRRA